MPHTSLGVYYPDAATAYPEADWWKDQAESIDEAIIGLGMQRVGTGHEQGDPSDPEIPPIESVTIPVPVGEYTRLRLTLQGGLDAVSLLSLRINGDTTTDMHRGGRIVRRASDGTVVDSGLVTGSLWRLCEWGSADTGNCIVDIVGADGQMSQSFQARGSRMSNSDATLRTTDTWGWLSELREVSSLVLLPGGTAAEFAELRWWLEGIR